MAEPPSKRRRLSAAGASGRPGPASFSRNISPPSRRSAPPTPLPRKMLPSPFRLTTIRDLPPESNVGAVSLRDLLGDPLIASCWDFNYLHDVDWLMTHFDEDTRSLVKVHVVHGFWKREDPNRLVLHVSRLFRCQGFLVHTRHGFSLSGDLVRKASMQDRRIVDAPQTKYPVL
jgi:tyrosyl-DNA phosphodiesterase 1